MTAIKFIREYFWCGHIYYDIAYKSGRMSVHRPEWHLPKTALEFISNAEPTFHYNPLHEKDDVIYQ